jgi:quercetin dioxygenase-like cupin family protein
MIILHDEQPASRGYYSKILNRPILGAEQGLATCTIVDQIIPAGGYIVPHSHDYEEVLTFIAGAVTVSLEDATFEVSAPASVLIPAGALHEVRNPGGQPARLIAYHATSAPHTHYPAGDPAPVDWDAE